MTRLLTPIQIIRGSGGAYIIITSTPGATIACGADTYTLGNGETSHAFEVTAGTYACSAALSGYITATQSVTITSGLEQITLRPYLLPVEYQQVTYLQSDGVAFIASSLLGVPTNNIVKIGFIIDYLIYNTNYNGCPTLYGVSGYMQVGYWYNTVTVGNSNAAYSWQVGESYEAEIDNGALSINGVNTGLTRAWHSYNNNLFWNGSNGTRGGTIRYIQRYDSNNVLQFNMLPCYRKADNVAGMYDTISGTFLTNSAASGNFVCGEDL